MSIKLKSLEYINKVLKDKIVKKHIDTAIKQMAKDIEKQSREQWPAVEPSWFEGMRKRILRK